ncbi:MAG TPA: RHS repeat-associated core domain-containing protein [Patescibacteria group bacterium]|nr:RHS repeat-associated core domain-containing protein [Patescibacteria group bacterium]
MGFQTNHYFDSGAFGENIDILNGGVGLTVPIGQRFQVNSRLGYQVMMSYSSKIWDSSNFNNPFFAQNDQTVPYNEGPTGIGFSMHLGRIYVDSHYIDTCDFTQFDSCWTRSWVWVAPDGSQHEFFHQDGHKNPDGSSQVMPFGNVTTDNTFIKVLGPSDQYCYPSTNTGCFQVKTPDGLVYSLAPRVSCLMQGAGGGALTAQQMSENHSYCGWYTTLIEDPTVGSQGWVQVPPSTGTWRIQTPYPNNVVVTYDTRPGFEHAITSIADSAGRTTVFQNCEYNEGLNGATNDPPAGIVDNCKATPANPANRHAVATYLVNMPAFGASTSLVDPTPPGTIPDEPNTLKRATYRLYYEYAKIKRADPYHDGICIGYGAGQNLSGCFQWPALKLVRVDYPDVTKPSGSSRAYSLYYGYNVQSPKRCTISGNLCSADSECPSGQTCESDNFNGDYGEVACRTLPIQRLTGNGCGYAGYQAGVTQFNYSMDYYMYIGLFLSAGQPPKKVCGGGGGTCGGGVGGAVVPTGVSRQMALKTLSMTAGTVSGTWRYDRNSLGGTTNPTKVTVTDPVGNDTVYFYKGSVAVGQSGDRPDDGYAPEWDDGLTYRIDTYLGKSSTGQLLRSEIQDHDADFSPFYPGHKCKQNVRDRQATTQFWDDGGVEAVIAHGDWDSIVGRWRTETETGSGIDTPRVTRTEWTGGAGTIYRPEVLLKEVSDATRVLSREDNAYNAAGKLTTSVARLVPPATRGTEYPNPIVPNPGDVVTTYTYSTASGNLMTKTLSTGGSDPTYAIGYTYAPATGTTCTVQGECGGYLATKAFKNGAVYPWNAIDRTRDANTGLIMATKDTAGVQTTYGYDKLGRIETVTPAGEDATNVDYTSLTQTIVSRGSTTGSNYIFTRYLYDTLGRLVSTQKRPADPTNYACQKKEYDILGRVVYATEWMYQAPGACTGIVNHSNEPGTVYDFTDPGSGNQDPFGRVRREVPPQVDAGEGDHSTLTTYFGNSSQVTVNGLKGPQEVTLASTTTYFKDVLGRLVSVDAPGSAADATYTYDALDRLLTVDLTDPSALTSYQYRHFAYDGLGHQVWSENPENGTVLSQKYDALGNLMQQQDAAGNVIRLDYDFAGRPRHKYTTPLNQTEVTVLENIYNDSTADLSLGKLTTLLSYDPAGNPLLTEQRLYNGLGGRMSDQVHTFSNWSGVAPETTHYDFDTRGQLVKIVYPHEPNTLRTFLTVDYNYNNGMAVNAVEDGIGTILGSLSYNAAGAVSRVDMPGGGRNDITYDVRNRPREIVGGQWGSVSWNRIDYDSGLYKYDGGGNIFEMGANVYGYDASNRLVSAHTFAQPSTTYDESFNYDFLGNMKYHALTTISGVQTDEADNFYFATAAPFTNQIPTRQTTFGGTVTASPVTFAYDVNGNMLAGGRRWQVTAQSPVIEDVKLYSYDVQNRLQKVYVSGSNAEVDRFAYDLAGNRIWKRAGGNGGELYYVRDATGQVLSEFRMPTGGAVNPEWSSDYVYLGGRLLSLKENLRPSAPKGLRATTAPSGSGFTITLTWDENSETDKASYRVYRKREGIDTSFSVVAMPNATSNATISYADPTVEPTSTVVDYQVTVVDTGSFESSASKTLKVAAGDATRPTAPDLLPAVPSNGQIYLKWNPGTDASDIVGYEVWRGTAPSSGSDTIAPLVLVTPSRVVGNDYLDVNLVNGTTYYYRVRAVDAAGNGGFWSCISGGPPCDRSAIPTDRTPPVPPKNPRASSTCGSSGTPESVVVSWDANPPVSPYLIRYVIYRSTSPVFTGVNPIATQPGTTFTDPGPLTAGTTYYYALQAIHNIPVTGQGIPPGTEITITTSALSQIVAGTPRDSTLTPQLLMNATATDGAVNLSWQPDPLQTYPGYTPDKFIVYRRLNATRSCSDYVPIGQISGGVWSQTFSDPTPANNMAYDYAISVRYQGRESSLSRQTLAIPLARTQNYFMCGKYPFTVVGWTPPNAPVYQSLTATAGDGEVSFLKGYHLYHHKRCPPRDGAMFKDNSPMRELVTNAADTIDPYLVKKPTTSSTDFEYYDPRYAVGTDALFSPALPSDIDTSISFDCYSGNDRDNCMAPRAVYKVYAEGTWLTVESDWPDYFHPLNANPDTRCDHTLMRPSDPSLPYCTDSVHYSDFVPPPLEVTAAQAGPGSISLSWKPPVIAPGQPPVAGYFIYARDAYPSIEKVSVHAPVPLALAGPGETQAVIGNLPIGYGMNGSSPVLSGYQVRVATLDEAGRVSGEAYRCATSGTMCSPGAGCAADFCAVSLRDCTGSTGQPDQSKCSYGVCSASHLACSSTGTCAAGACSNTPTTGCTPIERIENPWELTFDGSSTSATYCSGTPPRNGDSLVAVVGTRGASINRVSSITGPTKSDGTAAVTWTRVTPNATNTNGTTAELWYSSGSTNANNRCITITLASAVKAAAIIQEYSGRLTGTTSDFDRSNPGTGNSNAPNSGATAQTRNDSEIWIGGMAAIGPRTYSGITAGFSPVAHIASGFPGDGTDVTTEFMDSIVTAKATASVNATLDTAAQWAAMVATLKAWSAETIQCSGGNCAAQTCWVDTCAPESCNEGIGRYCQNHPDTLCTVSSDCPGWHTGHCDATITTACDPGLANTCPTGQVCMGGDVCVNDPVWIDAKPGAETVQPSPPAAVRSVVWTVNVSTAAPDNIVKRGRDGIKVAWEPGRRIASGSTILGFRVYRSAASAGPYCILLDSGGTLPPGTTLCDTDVPTRSVDQDAYDVNYSAVYNSTSGYIHNYWDRTVAASRTYYYRVTQVESNGGPVLETPLASVPTISAMALAYDTNRLPPPQNFRAWAPWTGLLVDQQSIALGWCPVPSASDSPDSDLPTLAYYNVYRTGFADYPYRLIAKISASCLTAGNRCEITGSNGCLASNGITIVPGCTPITPVGGACGGTGQQRCGVVDKTFVTRGFDSCWPVIWDSDTMQDRFKYKYYVTAVASLAGGATSESMPSIENRGWSNYCGTTTFNYDGTVSSYNHCTALTPNCVTKRDPEGDGGDYQVCGNENALFSPAPPDSSLSDYWVVGDPPRCDDCGGGGGGGGGSPPPNPYNPPSRWVFYHLDHLGSPRVTLGATGAIIATHHYLPFGEERPAQTDATLNDKAFTGHQRDAESGLDYMMARYYGSSLEKFMSPDPGKDTALEDPQSWNKYTYVRNNPLRRVDPDGLTAYVSGTTKKERKEQFKELKQNLKENGASKAELRSLRLNKKTGEVTQSGGAAASGNAAFSSFQDVLGESNRATYHFVPSGGSATARDGTSYSSSLISAAGHGGLTILDRSGDTNPQGGVDVEIFVNQGGNPGGLPSAADPSKNVADPEHLVAAHETREAFEHMFSSAPLPGAHHEAVDLENQLRSSQGLGERAP